MPTLVRPGRVLVAVTALLGTVACGEKFTAASDGSGGSAGSGGKAETGADGAAGPAISRDGMVLWLRADRGVTAKNGTVSRWDDQSPEAARATQYLAAQQPTFATDGINGKPALVFDGTDDFLQLGSGMTDLAAGLTMLGVVDTETQDVCTAMFEASNGAEINDISFGQNGTQLNYEIVDGTNEDVPYPAGVPVLFSIVHNPDETVAIRSNGAFAANAQFAAPESIQRQAIYVGKTLYANCPSFSGKIAELIVYARALAGDEVQAIEAYLQGKYRCCGL